MAMDSVAIKALVTSDPIKTPSVIIFGATSVLAGCLIERLIQKNYRITLVARDEQRLIDLTSADECVDRKKIEYHVSALNTHESIKNTFEWIGKKHNGYDLLIICPAVMFADDAKNGIDSYIESVNINLMLILYAYKYISDARIKKIAVIGSIFALAPKRNKLFYSHLKKLVHIFFNTNKRENAEQQFLFHLGPMYTPMYKGPRRAYVSEPSEIAKVIITVIENKRGGVYIIPLYWKILMPFLYVLNLILR